MRPGFEVVRKVILQCVPEADAVWFDPDREQIVFSIEGNAQPFDNLSAGQRMMFALVADLAIKAVTQNAFLLPPEELGPEDQPWPGVLRKTPGLVLIDELDVHLHPKWQRRVATDLKQAFPSMQFVCTSHSPQVIGEVEPNEIRLLGAEVTIPNHSFGIDSSRVLEEIMDAKPRTESVELLLRKLFELIDKEDFAAARELLPEVEHSLGQDDPEVTRARSLMTFLESKARNKSSREMNEVLNLNEKRLQNNRKAVLDAFQTTLSKWGHLQRHTLENLLADWDGNSRTSELRPYCQVVVYWLRKRLPRSRPPS